MHELIEQVKSSRFVDHDNAMDELAGFRESAVPDLTDILKKDTSDLARGNAAKALGRIGTYARDAIPSLIQTLKIDANPSVRGSAAAALGEIGVRREDVASALLQALKDDHYIVAWSASMSLARIGAVTREVVPALVEALKARNPTSPTVGLALFWMGADAKDAVPELIDLLQSDTDPNIRAAAAEALGGIAAKLQSIAKEVVPVLIEALKDRNPSVCINAANSLTVISRDLYEAKATQMLPALHEAYKSLSNHPNELVRRNAVELRRTTEYFESLQRVGFIEKILLWIIAHPPIGGIIGAYLFLLIVWSLVFWLRPRWLPYVSVFFSHYEVKIGWPVEMKLPFRHLLLVSLFHHRRRVLDRWILEYLVIARGNLANRTTVKERRTYVRTPLMINDEQILEGLSPVLLQPFFDKPKVTLLIAGEGGAGKTSLACQIALWAMIDEPKGRLCKSHLMLPVMIEDNLELQATGSSALIEYIRGHLRELIGTPDELSEEFVLQLLRKRRVLVLVDSLSELSEETRRAVRPAQAEFPIAALVVTSRADDLLGAAAKTTIKPLRLNKERLSFFMDRYLEQRGRQFDTDQELYESCRNLSQLVGERDITALIAKMYAELSITAKEQPSDYDLPHNLPDLMQGYLGNINEGVKADRQETRAVLRAAKALAWECLRRTCRPAPAKRDDALKALRRNPEAEAMLEYLERRLQLIQTTGAGKDAIRFSLDPLAEYLAGMYLVEHYNNSVTRWQEIIALLRAQPGGHEQRKGFLLALHECCKHHGQEHGVPGTAIEAINQLLFFAPSSVVSAD